MTDQPPRQLALALPNGVPPLVGVWVSALEDGRRRTKVAVVDVDQPTLDWLAPGSANSIGTLLYHIAATEMEWLCVDLLGGRGFSPEIASLLPHGVRDERGGLVRVAGEALAEHVRRLDATRRHLVAAFANVTDEEFRRPRPAGADVLTPQWVL